MEAITCEDLPTLSFLNSLRDKTRRIYFSVNCAYPNKPYSGAYNPSTNVVESIPVFNKDHFSYNWYYPREHPSFNSNELAYTDPACLKGDHYATIRESLQTIVGYYDGTIHTYNCSGKSPVWNTYNTVGEILQPVNNFCGLRLNTDYDYFTVNSDLYFHTMNHTINHKDIYIGIGGVENVAARRFGSPPNYEWQLVNISQIRLNSQKLVARIVSQNTQVIRTAIWERQYGVAVYKEDWEDLKDYADMALTTNGVWRSGPAVMDVTHNKLSWLHETGSGRDHVPAHVPGYYCYHRRSCCSGYSDSEESYDNTDPVTCNTSNPILSECDNTAYACTYNTADVDVGATGNSYYGLFDAYSYKNNGVWSTHLGGGTSEENYNEWGLINYSMRLTSNIGDCHTINTWRVYRAFGTETQTINDYSPGTANLVYDFSYGSLPSLCSAPDLPATPTCNEYVDYWYARAGCSNCHGTNQADGVSANTSWACLFGPGESDCADICTPDTNILSCMWDAPSLYEERAYIAKYSHCDENLPGWGISTGTAYEQWRRDYKPVIIAALARIV
jgi:hypothetical protein